MTSAASGFPVSAGLRHQHKYGIAHLNEKFLSEWPGSATLYLKNGKEIPEVGGVMKNEALARVLDHLANSRDPHAEFYRGDIATEIAKFSKEKSGLLERAYLERRRLEVLAS